MFLFNRKMMEWEADHFSPNLQDVTFGPLLLTKMYEEYMANPHPDWKPIQILKSEVLYPFPHDKVELLLKQQSSGGVYEQHIRNSIMVHVGRNRLRYAFRMKHIIPPENSILQALTVDHCEPVAKNWR